MTDEIVFYHNPQSRALMAHWMLEEAERGVQVMLIDFNKGEHKTPEFLAINPMGKPPPSCIAAVVTERRRSSPISPTPSRPRASPGAGRSRAAPLSLAVLRLGLHGACPAQQDG